MSSILFGKTFTKRIIKANDMGKQTERQQLSRASGENSSHKAEWGSFLGVLRESIRFCNTSVYQTSLFLGWHEEVKELKEKNMTLRMDPFHSSLMS